MNRREMLMGGAGGLAGLAAFAPGRAMAQALFAAPAPLVPLIATNDRLMRVTVCLRPFRAAGPRIAVEEVGRKRVVHHYGHGGSGWSLSWGSALEALPLALADGARRIAVIGAGAIGLTTAITAQRMGAEVTIYARERFPYVRSARATGTWSPDSRIAMEGAMAADFPAVWERMTRASFAFHQRYLGLAGDPVEWTERYELIDRSARHHAPAPVAAATPRPDFAWLEPRVRGLTPDAVSLAPGTHPFAAPEARRRSALTFNVAALSHQLEEDFLLGGGRFEHAEFHKPADLARIPEKVIVNCTGYGARALFGDDSVVPVRGQIAWLIPQAGLTYGVYSNGLTVLGRRDGIVLQPTGGDDYFGYDDANEEPDYAAAYAAVAQAAGLYAPARTVPA